MANEPGMRAGDADRDRAARLLSEAYAEGRVDADEFQERLERAHEARTFGELEVLLSDLPIASPTASPAQPTRALAAEDVAAAEVVEQDAFRRKVRQAWAAWIGVGVMMNIIWATTWMTKGGDAPSYWPLWVLGPWGAGLLIWTISGRQR